MQDEPDRAPSPTRRARPARAGFTALLMLAIVAVTAACDGRSDTTPVPLPAAPSVACFSVPLDQCRLITDIALGALPAHPPVSYMEVGPPSCAADPCPQALLPGGGLRVTVQFLHGQPRLVTVQALAPGLQAMDAGDPGLIELTPSSQPAIGPGPHPFSLGHCGVQTGIDFDRSFWDPVGSVDFSAPAAINSADGTLLMTSPNTARFATATGFRLDLVRHKGSKFFSGCA